MKPYIIPLISGLIFALIGFILVLEWLKFGFKFLIIFVCILFLFISFFSIPTFLTKIKNLFLNLRWWHILWALFLISGQTFRLRFAKSVIENPLDKAAMFRVLLVSFIGALLLLAFASQREVRLNRILGGPIKWLFIFSVICILSTFWSCFPLWTLYRSVEYFIGVFLVSFIICNLKTEKEFKLFLDWSVFLYGLLLLSVLFGLIWNPSMALRHGIGLLGVQIEGVFPKIAANGVGQISALIALISLVRFLLYSRDHKFYFLVFVVSVITLIFSQSRSPLVGFLLGVVLILFLSRKIKWFLFSISIVSIMVFIGLMHIFMDFFIRGQSADLFWSLSGRVPAWKVAFSVFKENPVLGYGAYAAGRFLVSLKHGYLMSSLHSDWVETLIGTGILGVTFLFISLLTVWLTILKASSLRSLLCRQLRLETLSILTLLTFRSVFSVPLIWHPAIPWLLVVGFAQFLKIKNACSSRT